jgi:Domain of unknown function (DUF4160)
MPTVLRQAGFEVRIFTHDHTPPHVHVFKGGEEVVINLSDVSLRDVYMNNRDVRRASAIVADHQEFLLAEWNRIKPIP